MLTLQLAIHTLKDALEHKNASVAGVWLPATTGRGILDALTATEDAPLMRAVLRDITKGRCYACGWPMTQRSMGCAPFNCSFRPSQEFAGYASWLTRAREMAELAVRLGE